MSVVKIYASGNTLFIGGRTFPVNSGVNANGSSDTGTDPASGIDYDQYVIVTSPDGEDLVVAPYDAIYKQDGTTNWGSTAFNTVVALRTLFADDNPDNYGDATDVANNASEILAVKNRVTTTENDIADIEKAVQISKTSGGGRGLYYDDGKSTTSSLLSVGDGAARMQAGSGTYIGLSEQSPGVQTFTVASGASGSETPYDAIVLSGKTTANTASFNLKDGTRLGFDEGSYSVFLFPETLTASRSITLPDASGTVALTSDIPSFVGYVDTTGTPANNQVAVFTDQDTIEGSTALIVDGANVGIGTTAPESSLHIAGTSGITMGRNSAQNQVASIYADSGDNLRITSATGSGKSVWINGYQFGSSINWDFTNSTGNKLDFSFSPNGWNGSNAPSLASFNSTVGYSTGDWNMVKIENTLTQSGDAAFTDFLINRTENSVGTGNQYYINAKTNNQPRFNVSSQGDIYAAGEATIGSEATSTNTINGKTVINSSGSNRGIVLNYTQTDQTAPLQINVANTNRNWQGIRLQYTDDDGVSNPVALSFGMYNQTGRLHFTGTEFKFEGADLFMFNAPFVPAGGFRSQYHTDLQYTLASNDGRTSAATAHRFLAQGSTASGTNINGELMRISGNGRVGIGTTSPSTALHVEGCIAATGNLNAYTNTGSVQIGHNGSTSYISANAGGGAVEDLSFYNGSGAENMRLTSSGRLGIGTTAPSEKLHVVGNMVLDGGSSNMFIGDSNTGDGITAGQNNVGIGSQVLRSTGSSTQYAVAIGIEASRFGNNDHGTSIGYAAGYNGAQSSAYVGSQAGRLASGQRNVGIGYRSGGGNSDGVQNLYGNVSIGYEAGAVLEVPATAIGYLALASLTTGSSNTAVGYQAADAVTTGYDNTIVGNNAADIMTTGYNNTAVGKDTLRSVTSGYSNTAIGAGSVSGGVANTGVGTFSLYNSVGIWNTALGMNAGYSVSTGNYGTFVGGRSGRYTTGENNTLVGYEAGAGVDATSTFSNTVGVGYQALTALTTGVGNTAVGYQALSAATANQRNTAVGYQSLKSLNSGNDNTAFGFQSLIGVTSGNYNTSLGFAAGDSLTTGNNNTLVGHGAGSQLVNHSGNVMIGFNAGYNETSSNKLYIENSNSSTPLIYGEFDNDILRVNGELQVGDPTSTGFKLPTTDGEPRQVLSTDGAGNVSWTDDFNLVEEVKNVSAGTLYRGTPVHVTGSTGQQSEVIAADAASNYPAHYILDEDLTANASGKAILTGAIIDVDLTPFSDSASNYSEGDEVYLGASGGFTTTRPTGTNAVQLLGVILKVNTGGNKISGMITGMGRVNNLPNIANGKVWVGDSNGYPTETTLATVATTNSYTDLINKPLIPEELSNLSGDTDDITEGATNLFFTSAERSKLSGIAAGAEVNVQSDWNALTGDAAILNKPNVVLDEQYELDELKVENNIHIGSVGTTSDRIYDVVNEVVASDSSTTTGVSLLGFWDGSKMTLQGMVAVGGAISSPVAGAPLYLGTNGAMTHTAPTTSGYIARVIGHYVVQLQSGDHMVYFNPSNSWVEID